MQKNINICNTEIDEILGLFFNDSFNVFDDGLCWNSAAGIGFYPVKPIEYGKDYFEKYQRYGLTDMGILLNTCRIQLVNKYTNGNVLDVGIGSGSFLVGRDVFLDKHCTQGYDVNLYGIEFLKHNQAFFDIYVNSYYPFECLTFFDSLEHIVKPSEILKKLSNQYVIVSIPIFKSVDHVLKSRHYRKDEHYYYFTESALINYMRLLKCELVEVSDFEIQAGREGIYTFVFKKQ